ncbi:hypothetical protein DPMN_131716 [Dreissena polymorpha]|uniref:Uncharacterized protein n=1 Tax=Dreissena polymorpha TaxID=45954 RepID=A0A9D4FR57_DREPO|nr:hypothetical protein DPMN_131716 [Dreissena polymorpha]
MFLFAHLLTPDLTGGHLSTSSSDWHSSTCTGEQTTHGDRSIRLTGSSSQPRYTC